jgi:uncharacterized protein YdaU (DUF1376 family)
MTLTTYFEICRDGWDDYRIEEEIKYIKNQIDKVYTLRANEKLSEPSAVNKYKLLSMKLDGLNQIKRDRKANIKDDMKILIQKLETKKYVMD